jgi:hypothetical protein
VDASPLPTVSLQPQAAAGQGRAAVAAITCSMIQRHHESRLAGSRRAPGRGPSRRWQTLLSARTLTTVADSASVSPTLGCGFPPKQ